MAAEKGDLVMPSMDFLVVTAMKDEYEALTALLPGHIMRGPDAVASIPRIGTSESYQIALIVSGQTTAAAQGAVFRAIDRCHPRGVILTGIAAGFPESGINYGDVLIPHCVVPYGYIKTTEATTPPSNTVTIETSHRGTPLDVSTPLFEAASALSRNRDQPWLLRLNTERPSSKKPSLMIHADWQFIMGSGDELVATELSETRQWLLLLYKRNAIGLEMEAYGAIMACRSTDTPFLMVKACQDPATVAKDNKRKKDRWRNYAEAAAAAFVVTLIERYDFPNGPYSHAQPSYSSTGNVIHVTDRPRTEQSNSKMKQAALVEILKDRYPAEAPVRLHKACTYNDVALLNNGQIDLSSEEKRRATAFARELKRASKPDDLCAVVSETPAWHDEPATFRHHTAKYSQVRALRQSGSRFPLLSAAVLLVCKKENCVVLHRRSPTSDAHPNKLHTFGGTLIAHQMGGFGDVSGMRECAERELREETGVPVVIPNTIPATIIEEHDIQFVQVAYLGVPISSAQVRRLRPNWEGTICKIGFDSLRPDLLKQDDWVPSGLLHLLLWLALGAPGSEGATPSRKGRTAARFAGLSPEELCGELVTRL